MYDYRSARAIQHTRYRMSPADPRAAAERSASTSMPPLPSRLTRRRTGNIRWMWARFALARSPRSVSLGSRNVV
jgi:hypothetical protein